ncbi:hypothetical protein M404DRAFT_140937, partial [Pisolithus tinctorius Marx 270]
QNKLTYTQTDLCTKFLNLQCPVNGDICQFLDNLHTKRDELAAVKSMNLVNDGPISAPTIELYNSGSTRHISPYKEKFESLMMIPPRLFSATNKQLFSATAMGELVIEVPNGYEVTKL